MCSLIHDPRLSSHNTAESHLTEPICSISLESMMHPLRDRPSRDMPTSLPPSSSFRSSTQTPASTYWQSPVKQRVLPKLQQCNSTKLEDLCAKAKWLARSFPPPPPFLHLFLVPKHGHSWFILSGSSPPQPGSLSLQENGLICPLGSLSPSPSPSLVGLSSRSGRSAGWEP